MNIIDDKILNPSKIRVIKGDMRTYEYSYNIGNSVAHINKPPALVRKIEGSNYYELVGVLHHTKDGKRKIKNPTKADISRYHVDSRSKLFSDLGDCLVSYNSKVEAGVNALRELANKLYSSYFMHPASILHHIK